MDEYIDMVPLSAMMAITAMHGLSIWGRGTFAAATSNGAAFCELLFSSMDEDKLDYAPLTIRDLKLAVIDLLMHYLGACLAFAAAPLPHVVMLDATADDLPVDVFEADPIGINHQYIYASTASGIKYNYAGKMRQWCLHMLINGANHPATREPLQAFGIVQQNGSVAVPLNTTWFPTLSTEDCGELLAQLRAWKELVLAEEAGMGFTSWADVLEFEARFLIPETKRYSYRLAQRGKTPQQAGFAM
jgi:hypothetical protein